VVWAIWLIADSTFSIATTAATSASVPTSPLGAANPKGDWRPSALPIQSQGIITKDNVSIDVAAVAYYRVVDPPVRRRSRDLNLIAGIHPQTPAITRDSTNASADPDGTLPSVNLRAGNVKAPQGRRSAAWRVLYLAAR
jgi:hypothetical protein